MSMVICEECEKHFDSDLDPECFVSVYSPAEFTYADRETMSEKEYEILCEHCRNEYLEAQEALREEWAAGELTYGNIEAWARKA